MVGELVIRGAHVMKGYWEKPEATARALRPGPLPGERVLHTGDLFRTDEEGFLYFVGRKDDIIKSRGEKVAPKEVENVIYALPGVAEAAVIGVPDPILGQAIKAFVAPEPGIDLDERRRRAPLRALPRGLHGAEVRRVPPVAAEDRHRQDQPPPCRRNSSWRSTMMHPCDEHVPGSLGSMIA